VSRGIIPPILKLWNADGRFCDIVRRSRANQARDRVLSRVRRTAVEEPRKCRSGADKVRGGRATWVLL
jgi:hypothetical protein